MGELLQSLKILDESLNRYLRQIVTILKTIAIVHQASSEFLSHFAKSWEGSSLTYYELYFNPTKFEEFISPFKSWKKSSKKRQQQEEIQQLQSKIKTLAFHMKTIASMSGIRTLFIQEMNKQKPKLQLGLNWK